MKDCKKCNGDGYFYEADRRTPTRCECQNRHCSASAGSVPSEVLPLPDMGQIEGSPMPESQGSMRVDTLDGTSRYFAKRFAKSSK